MGLERWHRLSTTISVLELRRGTPKNRKKFCFDVLWKKNIFSEFCEPFFDMRNNRPKMTVHGTVSQKRFGFGVWELQIRDQRPKVSRNRQFILEWFLRQYVSKPSVLRRPFDEAHALREGCNRPKFQAAPQQHVIQATVIHFLNKLRGDQERIAVEHQPKISDFVSE